MKKIPQIAAITLALALVGGCTPISYYAQAMNGQMSLIASARPIDEWLANPRSSDDLKSRLVRAQEIRTFAARELALPDNGSYKTYADLKRPYVMWNVVATPELSMKPLQWCFPVAGCVDYRGYYNQHEAQRYADQLRAQSYDVSVSGVPAYSTLGWFNDPLLSTIITLPEVEVARLVFHELAHQVAYAPGDSPFNEAFATAVEEIGVALWLDTQADPVMRERYRLYQQRKRDFLELLKRHRAKLEDIYDSGLSVSEKRARKAEVLASIKREYQALKTENWSGYEGYDPWFSEPLSNAHFALISTYEDLVPAFQSLYADAGSLPKFYDRVKALMKLNKAQRRDALSAAHQRDTRAAYDRKLRAAAAQ